MEDPAHERLISTILHACLRHQLVPGVHCTDPGAVIRWREQGFRMLTVGSDVSFLRKAASDALRAIRDSATRAGLLNHA